MTIPVFMRAGITRRLAGFFARRGRRAEAMIAAARDAVASLEG
jgi:hypothetical protein